MLKQKVLRNMKLGTKFGEVTIDGHGVIKGLTEDQEQEFKDLRWYTFTPNKKPARTTDTATSKATTKKTTRTPRTRKSTTTKTTDKK